MGLVHTRRSQQFIRKYNQIGTLTDTITPNTTRLDSSNMPQTWAIAKLLQHAWQHREQFSGENMYALILRFTRMKKPIKIAFYKHGNNAVSGKANQLQDSHPKMGTKKWVGRWRMEQLTSLRHTCMRALWDRGTHVWHFDFIIGHSLKSSFINEPHKCEQDQNFVDYILREKQNQQTCQYMNVCIMFRCHLHVQGMRLMYNVEQKVTRNNMNRRKMSWITNENRERTRRNPSPISACEERMLSIVVFDSTHTHGSSKYFL